MMTLKVRSEKTHRKPVDVFSFECIGKRSFVRKKEVVGDGAGDKNALRDKASVVE
jgi:hypothetical protein